MYPRMSAAAFRAALARLGLSHSQAAVFLDKNIRLTRDWASGAKLIPRPIAARLIWCLVLIQEPLFEMFTPGCNATYFSIIEWNREVGVTLFETGRQRRMKANRTFETDTLS